MIQTLIQTYIAKRAELEALEKEIKTLADQIMEHP